jgi:ABC-type transport system involved in multi-copper enzyme maturation permease subunit
MILFGVWYNWIVPVWQGAAGVAVVGAGVAVIVTAAYFLFSLIAPRWAERARGAAYEAWGPPLLWAELVVLVLAALPFTFLSLSVFRKDFSMMQGAAEVAAIGAAIWAVYVMLAMLSPRTAAIARVTAQEAWSQPLFWVEMMLGSALLVLFPFLPYNTFGEDVKVVKDAGLALIVFLAVPMAVWTASVSVADEIEGRTALTLLSKPVRRHQFILGKFLGILAPTLSMFLILGALFLATVSYKVKHESRETSTPEPTPAQCQAEMVQIVPGLVLSFMEAVVLASISVAISTRLPMLPNLVICATIYVLGHLTPLLVQSRVGESKLVMFFGQLVAVVLPVLDHFNIQAAVTTGQAVPLSYLAWAGLYCVLYSTAAMLLALVFFDSRDLG